MFKYLISIIFIFSLAPILGCASQPGDLNADLGQQISLKAGQTASINGEQLKIRFVEVVSDSRCPSNAVCIWAGEVTCTIEIIYNKALFRKTLVKSGGSPEFVNVDFTEYGIAFDVQPYPEAGKEIKKDEYQLKLKITKKPV